MEEIEAKFLEININDLRKKLKKNNAKRVHKMMLYRRHVFHLLTDEKGYIRTREENGKVTITVKKYPANSKFATESEIELAPLKGKEKGKNKNKEKGKNKSKEK